MVLLPRDAP